MHKHVLCGNNVLQYFRNIKQGGCFALPSDFTKLVSWPEMTDIINILIRCEFAYHVEFGFICDY